MKSLMVVVALILALAVPSFASPEQVQEFAQRALNAAMLVQKPDAKTVAVTSSLTALAMVDPAKAKELRPADLKSDLLDALLNDGCCPKSDDDIASLFLILGKADAARASERLGAMELDLVQRIIALSALGAGAKLADNRVVVDSCLGQIEKNETSEQDWQEGSYGDYCDAFGKTIWLLGQIASDLPLKFCRSVIANSVEAPKSTDRILVQCRVIVALGPLHPQAVKSLFDEVKPIVSLLVKGDPKEDEVIGEDYSTALGVIKTLPLVQKMLEKFEGALLKPAGEEERELREDILGAVPDEVVRALTGYVICKNWKVLSRPDNIQQLVNLTMDLAKKSDWPDGPYAVIAQGVALFDLKQAEAIAGKISDPAKKSETYAMMATVAYFEAKPVLLYRYANMMDMLQSGE